jgi:hypothetical protein
MDRIDRACQGVRFRYEGLDYVYVLPLGQTMCLAVRCGARFPSPVVVLPWEPSRLDFNETEKVG